MRLQRIALLCLVATAAGLVAAGPALPATVPGISFTRADGTLVEFGPRTTVQCRTFKHRGRQVQTIDALVGGVRGATKRARWQVAVLPGRRVLRFPSAQTPDGPDFSVAPLFAYDATRDDEVSSSSGPAKGSMRITVARCTPRPRLVFTVNATLGGEAGGAPLRVTGRADIRG